ncbi:hypothetical protein [Haloarchaeobius sp. HRN-SO-5]|uniref:hypothetical protein n=1 Tax=Haloarchaeobius sp. HRN-SO-5 TaxID=3446118 RepID=UPI003EB87B38
MTNFELGRWLLVALAVLGLAFAAPVVSAHGDESTADDAPPYDGTVADWADWMDGHVTDHVGPGAIEWMESHMGASIDEMGRDVADGHGHGYDDGHDGHGYDGHGGGYDGHGGGYDGHGGGPYGQGC